MGDAGIRVAADSRLDPVPSLQPAALRDARCVNDIER
jgi:hypothetical protein